MTTGTQEKPSVSYRDILKIIESVPALPEPLTYGVLTKPQEIVPHGNATNDLRAMRFLDLIFPDGHKTQTLIDLAQATPEERRMIWRKILPEKYPEIFSKIPLAARTGNTLPITRSMIKALFEPSPNSGRMMTFFVGLARQAGWEPLPDRAGAYRAEGLASEPKVQAEGQLPDPEADTVLLPFEGYNRMSEQLSSVSNSNGTIRVPANDALVLKILANFEQLRQQRNTAAWTEAGRAVWENQLKLNLAMLEQAVELMERTKR